MIPIHELITIQDLGLRYQSPEGELEALKNISFSVYDKEFVSIIGPSGCGKSTLLSVIAGLLTADNGEVITSERADKGNFFTGYMLQKDCLFNWRTIFQNVVLGLEIRNIKTRKNLDYASELLHTYGLSEFADRYPNELSGGMRQRCALIRTLVARPELLLLDEAFSALDYQTRLAVGNDIYQIIRKEKKTAIIVTHDIAEAISLSDRVVVLTKRPATVKSIHAITFKNKDLSPLERREQPEFPDYFNKIWRDIDVHLQ